MDKRAELDSGSDPDSRFVTVGGLQIHYKRTGTGPPLLLLHGSGSSLQSWDPVTSALSAVCDVIRLDLPGFGLTGPRPDRDYRVQTYAKTVALLLDTLGIGAA